MNYKNVQEQFTTATLAQQLILAKAVRAAYLNENRGKPTNIEHLRKIDETINILKAKQ